MDAALARMERELPDDVLSVGAEARKRVAFWLQRIGAGGAGLTQLSDAMREISGMFDSLTARLLLVPWDGPPNPRLKSGVKDDPSDAHHRLDRLPARRRFDEVECTVSHLLRFPHPALGGRRYGEALLQQIAARGVGPGKCRV